MQLCAVAPFAGAWIEIEKFNRFLETKTVAPFAGAWIEISVRVSEIVIAMSLPSRERGLKYHPCEIDESLPRRSLRGSVD